MPYVKPNNFFVALIIIIFSFNRHVSAQELIDWKVGSKFSYVSTDMWKKENGRWEEHVIDKQGDVYTVSVIEDSKTIQMLVKVDGTFTRPKAEAAGGGTFSYVPIKLPLVEGSEWEWTYHYIGKNMGAPAQVSRQCKAGKMEDVTVPAGKFTARRIDCRGSWTSTAGSSGSATTKLWYGPSLAVTAKRDETSSYFGGRDGWTVVLDNIKTD